MEKVLNKFIIDKSKLVLTHLSAYFRFSKLQKPTADANFEYMKSVPYLSVVGSIMYDMVCSRPDIAYGVGVVSKFMGNPGKEFWSKVKWILRYLRRNTQHGILFGRLNGASCEVSGFVDSDFVGDLDKRIS